ncbi:MAG: hypothetical protein AAGU75_04615 [Bacillota bacterium]
MVIISKKIFLFGMVIVLLGIVCYIALFRIIDWPPNSSKSIFAGGNLHTSLYFTNETILVVSQQDENIDERFQRPSKKPPYPNLYSFADFQQENGDPPFVTKKFDKPEDLILAYYGILNYAANMLGYSGGCGTVGLAGEPYPYAYELLSKEKQKELTLKQFINSFEGIGYTTLLKAIPAYTPPGTPADIKCYMVEIEVITGDKMNSDEEYSRGSRFAYYYGLITVEKTPEGDWKIKDIDYIPEDFLCAPMHHWFYLSDAVVQIVYGDNLKLVDKIDKIEQEGDMISIYASGKGKDYRFDFVRLTNGYDILLHENILEKGVWRETTLLTDKWEYLKLTK